MANKKISQLNEATSLNDADEFAVVQAGETKKVSLTTLTDKVKQSGAGDTSGPATSTDNAIVRWDGTTGKIIQNSGVIVDDNNDIHLPSGNDPRKVVWDAAGENTKIEFSNKKIEINSSASGQGAETILKSGPNQVRIGASGSNSMEFSIKDATTEYMNITSHGGKVIALGDHSNYEKGFIQILPGEGISINKYDSPISNVHSFKIHPNKNKADVFSVNKLSGTIGLGLTAGITDGFKNQASVVIGQSDTVNKRAHLVLKPENSSFSSTDAAPDGSFWYNPAEGFMVRINGKTTILASVTGPLWKLHTDKQRVYRDTAPTGIGTADPQVNLHVNGATRIEGLTTAPTVGAVLKAVDTNGTLDWGTDSTDGNISTTDFTFAANRNQNLNGKKLGFTGGNVGIGTADPQYNLDITGSNQQGSGLKHVARLSTGSGSNVGDATSLLFTNRHEQNDYGGYIALTNTGATPTWLNPRMDFGIQKTGTNELTDMEVAMTITSDKNVGIGTSTPIAPLHIKPGSNKSEAIFESPEQQSIVFRREGVGNWMLGRYAQDNSFVIAKDFTYTDTNNHLLTIKSDGKVGIGVNSPGYKLDVDGAIQAKDGININRDGDAYVQLQNNGASYGQLRGDNGNGIGFYLPTLNSGSYSLYAKTDGKVGIGTSAPNVKLHAKGNTAYRNQNVGMILETPDKSGLMFEETGAGYSCLEHNSAGLNFYLKSGTGTGAATDIAMRMDFSKNVGIGTTTGAIDAKLHVKGSLKIENGNQGAGKVLTSDANGLATWSDLGSVSGGKVAINDVNGDPVYYATLQEAITAATAGQTVQILTNITEAGDVEVILKNGVNINGNGHTYTATNTGAKHALSDNTIEVKCSITNLNVKRLNGTGYSLNIFNHSSEIDATGSFFSNDTTHTVQSKGTINNCEAENTAGTGFIAFAGGVTQYGSYHNCRTEKADIGFKNAAVLTNCYAKTTNASFDYAGGSVDRSLVNCYGHSASGIACNVAAGNLYDITGCQFISNGNYGFYTNAIVNLTGCFIKSTTSSGANIITNTSKVDISGCKIYSSAYIGLSINAGFCKVVGSTIVSDGAQGFHAGGGAKVELLNNHIESKFDNIIGKAIDNDGSTTEAIIKGNILKVANVGAPAISSDHAVTFKMADNGFAGSPTTPVHANVTQGIQATHDNFGNINL